MSINYLTQELNNIENAKRENRQRVANIVLENKDLMQDLVDITFDVNNNSFYKSCLDFRMDMYTSYHKLDITLFR